MGQNHVVPHIQICLTAAWACNRGTTTIGGEGDEGAWSDEEQGRSGHGLTKRLCNEEFSTRRKKKLLIQDLNGLLADINQDKHRAHLSHGKFWGKLGKFAALFSALGKIIFCCLCTITIRLNQICSWLEKWFFMVSLSQPQSSNNPTVTISLGSASTTSSWGYGHQDSGANYLATVLPLHLFKQAGIYNSATWC